MNTHLARRLYLLEQQKQTEILPHFFANSTISAVWIGDKFTEQTLPFYPFAQSKNLLGQEFDLIIYDCTSHFHLESLAIASGTLKAGGILIMLIDNWQTWQQQIDQDSLRWHNSPVAISAVNFRNYFKQCYQQQFAHLPPLEPQNLPQIPLYPNPSTQSEPAIATPTAEQQKIIQQILLQQADCYIVTAARGRGKSALAGLLANQLTAPVYITSANKSAVKILQKFCQRPINFIAPDELFLQLNQQTNPFAQSWLIVDEAAMLPIHFLLKFNQHFKHTLFSTTLHSYEGTGRGFELKFMQEIKGTVQQFHLQQPLRWAEQDPLEQLVEQLLLFNPITPTVKSQSLLPQASLPQTSLPQSNAIQPYQLLNLNQQDFSHNLDYIQQFYTLLTLAHYRTSPIDLRRLFDGKQQQFWLAQQPQQLLAGVWAIYEGAMQQLELIEQIQQGIRRPKGNLVAQLLCFQQQLPQACQLKSLRISRIAVQPQYQQQGIGTKLIQQLIEHYQHNSTENLDYLSVSFGYQARLAQFWQQCGFELVYLGEHKEASTGYYNAVALYPLSSQGNALCQQAKTIFYRNIGFQPHPLSLFFAPLTLDWQLQPQDWLSLKNFAKYHRTFYSAQPAIQRLIQAKQLNSLNLLIKDRKKYSHKQWLSLMRTAVGKAMEF